MDERFYLDTVSGRTTGLFATCARCVLWLASPMYRAAVTTRNRLFDWGWKRSHAVNVPVISIGNITTGGTGKTPVVAWVTQLLRSQGRQPGIVSRGYRSLDGAGNDELQVLKQLCPGVPHVQNRDRVTAAQEAISVHQSDIIVLDDGFQHRRLHRDVDIVLIDATNPWGYGHLLPRGLMREPRSALRRADVIVLTRVDQVNEHNVTRLRHEVSQVTNAPIAEVAFRPTGLHSLSGETDRVEALAGESVLAFCGIGNPEGFRRTLTDAGMKVTDDTLVPFADHHHYTGAELAGLVRKAASLNATALVTTQKDLVKLDSSWEANLPVWALRIGAEFITGQEKLTTVLSDAHSTRPSTAAESQ